MRRSDREVTDREQLLQMIRACQVCRLAMQDADGLYIVPMNFGFEWPQDEPLTLDVHCAGEGRRVSALKQDPHLAFEMDRQLQQIGGELPCSYGCLYESIIGTGEAFFLTDTAEKQHALKVLMKHQTGLDFSLTPAMAEAVTVLKIVASSVSGKARLQ